MQRRVRRGYNFAIEREVDKMKYGTISIGIEMLKKLRIVVAVQNVSIKEYLEHWIEIDYKRVMEGVYEQTSQTKC